MICNIISVGAQLKGSFQGASGARLVPRVRAWSSSDPRRSENAIATSARGRQTSTSINYARGAPDKGGGASEVVTKELGNSGGRANARTRSAQNAVPAAGEPAAKFPYYPRKRIWGRTLAAAARASGLRKSTCRIHNRKDANRQLGRGLVDEFSPTALTPQVKIHGRAAPFPESCRRQQLSPVIASFQSRRLACRIAVFKLRSLFALAGT